MNQALTKEHQTEQREMAEFLQIGDHVKVGSGKRVATGKVVGIVRERHIRYGYLVTVLWDDTRDPRYQASGFYTEVSRWQFDNK